MLIALFLIDYNCVALPVYIERTVGMDVHV